nr:hypothetical protein [Protofrankia coriariae]
MTLIAQANPRGPIRVVTDNLSTHTRGRYGSMHSAIGAIVMM